ncbi:hypothetical protein GIB67_004292, partial [Kingdonia uniflora]
FVTSQCLFHNYVGVLRAQLLFHSAIPRRVTIEKKKNIVFPWGLSIQIPKEVKIYVRDLEIKSSLLVAAVSTLETKHLVQTEDRQNDGFSFVLGNIEEVTSSSENAEEIDERERLRRNRISKANKGNVPWNKGRKHSEETIRLIRERTKLAMQDPKVKLKLMNLGHAQSKETRTKIGVGVRIGWQRRREKLMVQETCCFEWQHLIAEASRRGYAGEEELQWDTYTVLDKQLEQEWLEGIKHRKSSPRPKGSKRGPKSVEQRKKISEAISAKWADPEYRERVCSALTKYHGTPFGGRKKAPRRIPSGDADSVKKRVKKKAQEAYNGSRNETKSKIRLKKKRPPLYKDPSADSKLEMIKNIRAQRVAMETKKIEAMERAKLLISEAEKAAKALEVAARTSPLARASLLETRKLIAEATRSIQAVERGHDTSSKNKNTNINYSTLEDSSSSEEKEICTGNGIFAPLNHKQVNGTHVPLLNNEGSTNLHFSEFDLQSLLDNGELEETSFEDHLIDQLDEEDYEAGRIETNGDITEHPVGEKTGDLGSGEAENASGTTKKWVCGRLVEVSER